jgi:lysine 2,3-aminomutase
MGEDRNEYEGLYGYSLGQTEQRVPLYDYPESDQEITKVMNNLEL